MGVDYGWTLAEDGQLEYIIQIEPSLLQALEAGQVITSEIDPQVDHVRRFRIRVGNQPVPRQPPLKALQAASARPIDRAARVSANGSITPAGSDRSAGGFRLDDELDPEDEDRVSPSAASPPPRVAPLGRPADQPPQLVDDLNLGLDGTYGRPEAAGPDAEPEAEPETEPAVEHHAPPDTELAVRPDLGALAPTPESIWSEVDTDARGQGTGEAEGDVADAHRAPLQRGGDGYEDPWRSVPDGRQNATAPVGNLVPTQQVDTFAQRRAGSRSASPLDSPTPTPGLRVAQRGAAAGSAAEHAAMPASLPPETQDPDGEEGGHWLAFTLTLLALFASCGLNVYLGWITWDTYHRYQRLISELQRPKAHSAAS